MDEIRKNELLNKKREELMQKIKRWERVEIVEKKDDNLKEAKSSQKIEMGNGDNENSLLELSEEEKRKAVRQRLKQHITHPKPQPPSLTPKQNRYNSPTDFLEKVSIIRTFLESSEFYSDRFDKFPTYAYMGLFDQLFIRNKNKRFDCIYRYSTGILGDTNQGLLICVRNNWIRLSEYLSYNPNEEEDGLIPYYQAPIEEHLAFNHMEYTMTEMGYFQYLYFVLEGHNMNKYTIVWKKSQVKEWYDAHAKYMIAEKEKKIIDGLCLEPKIDKVEDGFIIDIVMFCFERRCQTLQFYETNGIKLPLYTHSSRIVRNKYLVLPKREIKTLSSEVVIDFTWTSEEIEKNSDLEFLIKTEYHKVNGKFTFFEIK